MPQGAAFKSNLLLLDVERGRSALSKRIEAGRKLTVWIKATIDHQHGNDDGTSIEFGCVVHSIKVPNGSAA